ncbi:MAG: hypothetical protein WD740_08915 [Anaerolineales bacterium]
MANENKVSKVRTSQSDPERSQRIFTFKATQWVWLVFGILEAMIALRIGLKLLGANAESSIVGAIYGITDLFLAPFVGLIGSPTNGSMVLELYSLFAILIYALIAWVVERIIWLAFYRPRGPVVAVTESVTSEQNTTTQTPKL